MSRQAVQPSDVTDLLKEFRPRARLVGVERIAGASKKGVYRLTFDDSATVILYRWSPEENYWPAGPDEDDDPFADATGAGLLSASARALQLAGVRVPHIYALDTRRPDGADLALIEDIRGGSLEDLLSTDPEAAVEPVRRLGEMLRAMAAQRAPWYGKVARIESEAGPQPPPHDVVLRRALRHLDAACARVDRLARDRGAVAELLKARHAVIRPRAEYGLVHGELGPDHVLIDDGGRPVLIDIEGLSFFDVEWEHAFLRLRFAPSEYRELALSAPDEARVVFYLLAQRISLIEGPMRIAATDYPERDWMLDLAEHHIDRVLAELRSPG